MYKAVVIDDEEDIRYLIKYLVEKCDEDIKVVGEAEDGESGVELCKKMNPHIIFADIRMPGMEGLEMIEKIHESLPYTQTVIISGYAYFSYAQKAMMKGATAYLLKPLEEEILQETLKKVKSAIEMKTKEEKNISRLEKEIKKFRETWQKKEKMDMESGVSNEQIKKALHYIHEKYCEDITLEEVANVVFMNSSYFSALFKKDIGLSFVSYVNKLRMQDAKRLLKEGKFKAVEIAHMLGFKDVSYFNRVFKKYYGHSPYEHKEKLQ